MNLVLFSYSLEFFSSKKLFVGISASKPLKYAHAHNKPVKPCDLFPL